MIRYYIAHIPIGTLSFLVASSGYAQEISVGDTWSAEYQLKAGLQDSTTIRHNEATFIKVHFSDIELQPGEILTVSSPDGQESYSYPSTPSSQPTHLQDLWANSIEGSEAVVQLSTSEGTTGSAHVDRYVAGNQVFLTESTCGNADDTKRAKCFESSNSTVFQKSKAVARILTVKSDGTFTCTAWRVGPKNNTMITNNHCISTQNHVNSTEVRFRDRHKNCSGSALANVVKVRGSQLLVTRQNTDVTLFTINNPSSVSNFGALTLANRNVTANEKVYIPQHPSGKPMRIGLKNAGAKCKVVSHSGKDVFHNCDTQKGSSGSPIISRDNHKVIGLHNAAGCSASGGANHGNKTRDFFNVVSPFL